MSHKPYHLGFVTATICILGLLHAADRAHEPGNLSAEPDRAVQVQYNVMVPMRDSVRLSTDIYRPDAEGSYPVILTRNPYGNGSGQNDSRQGNFWASRGYVYLYQDVRGRYDSEGAWYPTAHEGEDGQDAIQWAAEQPWSNGKVAMIGGSYMGIDQWQAACLGSPNLKTIVPILSPLSAYRSFHPGGAFLLGQAAWALRMAGRTAQAQRHDWSWHFWHLPVVELDNAMGYEIPFWRDWVQHANYDEYWEQIDFAAKIENVGIPTFKIGGWYDAWLAGTLSSHSLLQEQTKSPHTLQKLIIGPWPHTANPGRKTGEIDFGPDAGVQFDLVALPWMEYWLKGTDNTIETEAPVRLFVMGENRWRSEETWPPAGVQYQPYYLHSGGGANSSQGDGTLSSVEPQKEPFDRFDYDPRNPVPTRGGNLAGIPGFEPGPLDQAPVEARHDVLVYTSAALEQDMEVTGPLTMTLHAASSALDTDFTAKLVDVHPDGRAFNLADGIVRARFRESLTAPSLLEPGKVYRLRIDLMATSNVFKKGHRIRVQVSSSNFPRFSRNLNTGNSPERDTAMVTAAQRVYHEPDYPSHILLPVIAR